MRLHKYYYWQYLGGGGEVGSIWGGGELSCLGGGAGGREGGRRGGRGRREKGEGQDGRMEDGGPLEFVVASLHLKVPLYMFYA